MPRYPRVGTLAASKVVHCRFTAHELEALDRLVGRFGMKDRSMVIRAALQKLEAEHQQLFKSSHATPPAATPRSASPSAKTERARCRVCDRLGPAICGKCAEIMGRIKDALARGEQTESEILESVETAGRVSALVVERAIKEMIDTRAIQRMPRGKLALQQELPLEITKATSSKITTAARSAGGAPRAGQPVVLLANGKTLKCRGGNGACGSPICVAARALGLALCDDHFWEHAATSRPWLGDRTGLGDTMALVKSIRPDQPVSELRRIVTNKGTEALSVANALLESEGWFMSPAVRMALSKAGFVVGARATKHDVRGEVSP